LGHLLIEFEIVQLLIGITYWMAQGVATLSRYLFFPVKLPDHSTFGFSFSIPIFLHVIIHLGTFAPSEVEEGV
jgi:hypothetical protein